MKKFAKIINEEKKAVIVGMGTNESFYRSEGMTEMDVEQGYDGAWYVEGFAPVPPDPTEADRKRERLFQIEEEFRQLDYIGIKIATGRATAAEYAKEIARMEELAEEKNEIMSELAELEENE